MSLTFETWQSIIDTVNGVFLYSDSHDWDALQTCFADPFVLDYTSMNGGEPATLTPAGIAEDWRGFLPGFQATHHLIGNHRVRLTEAEAAVFCYGTATHYLPTETGLPVWTVAGTYDFRLRSENGGWKITRMTFHFKYEDGNRQLPALALQALRESGPAV
ncbi:nuclear transport factor 2 family protein [Larkinella soli]|uniref:nuclear transport factor 2 family protein n=1 Tax=Larkinella soli TaxID=1770527 RepID=UPI000FFB4A2F|nr:nuclear transport factor 2 family protein [Larkinella soli]